MKQPIAALLDLVACSGASSQASAGSGDDLYVLGVGGKKRPMEGSAECSDEWVVSLRQTEERPPGESVIIDGENFDPEEFDTVWIEQNCDMEARVIG